MNRLQAREFFSQIFQVAVQAVHPAHCLPAFLRQLPACQGKTVVIGSGKASAAMAQALEQSWGQAGLQGEYSGLVVTRYGQALPCQQIEVIEAAHPVPDAASVQAAQRILQKVQGLTEYDRVICLISGGGSALLSLPAAGITLADKQQMNRALLKSGASIAQMNCVRKHLSAIKGGRLALACAPAPVYTFLISDIPGDDASLIASGPSMPDNTTLAQARSILEKFQIPVSPQVQAYLTQAKHETPKPDHPLFGSNHAQIIASSQHALQAAARYAAQQGWHPHILSDCIEGEARDIGIMHAAIAKQILRHNQPFDRPCLLLSGGETSVTMKGNGCGGRGGRNTEFLLSLGLALQDSAWGQVEVHAFACDTDGIDGTENNAGASLHPDSMQRAQALGMQAPGLLDHNDSYRFFAGLDDLMITGPTHTNVNDLRGLLIC